MLNEGGEIHVAHRDNHPYNKWELEKLAQNAGLVLKEKVSFIKEHYPGYHNKRGSVIQGNKTFPLEDPFTFKFSIDHNHHQETTLSYSKTTISDDQILPAVATDHDDRDHSIRDNNHADDHYHDIIDNNYDEEITNDHVDQYEYMRVRGIRSFFRGCVGCVFGLMASYSLLSVLGVAIMSFPLG